MEGLRFPVKKHRRHSLCFTLRCTALQSILLYLREACPGFFFCILFTGITVPAVNSNSTDNHQNHCTDSQQQ
ncbi:hypothetical protein C3B58_06460 [Lactonifactor longoviformis]|nr:hypothetical protein C3B58_06460 [Lactonifactor longoviformis]